MTMFIFSLSTLRKGFEKRHRRRISGLMVFVCATFLLPKFVHAQAAPQDFASLVGSFLGIIALIIPVLFGLSLIVFIWGLISGWILNVGDEKSIENGKKTAFAGIIGLVVMAGVWGIVAIFKSSFF